MNVPGALIGVARIIVGEHADQDVLSRALSERLRSAPPHIAGRLTLAVALLDHPLANLLVGRRFVRLSRLDAGEGGPLYERWLLARVPIVRSIGHGVRRFVLSTYYAQPEAQAALGVRQPLHTREPELSWEGPLAGEPRDDEPVARAPSRRIPDEVRHPPRRALPSGVTSASGWTGTHYFRADVVVVGSGAGGAVAAARLAEAGRDVILVESGRWVETADFTEREHDIGADLYADRGLRTTDDQAITLLQGAALGGGTTVNWMLMLRTPDHVLEEWEDLGTEGMALTPMRAVFDRIEAETHATLVPDDAHSPSNRMLLDGARALGWHVESARINARGCVRAGTCSLGCRYGAKQSALQVYLPRALAAGGRILTEAAVERVVVTARDTGAGRPPQKRVYASSGGAEILIDAAVVVLAAGAVATPLILQRSGLGGGGVGKFLRLHPTTVVLARMPNETYPLAGIPQTTLCAEFAQQSDGYGYWIECPALTPGLAAAAASGIGAEHHAQLAQLDHLAALIALVRDGAARDESNGRIGLGRGGVPSIRYRLGARDAQHVRESIAASARIALAAGAEEVTTLHARPIVVRRDADLAAILSSSVALNDVSLFSAHVNGTCRIGRRAADAGVMPNGERFGVRGLYVCDGSILPTAPGVNPQETIYALSTVLVERMIAENKV